MVAVKFGSFIDEAGSLKLFVSTGKATEQYRETTLKLFTALASLQSTPTTRPIRKIRYV